MSTRVCIIVLGDVGRSPRMQNHALALADHGVEVDMVGYKGAKPPEALLSSNRIHLHYLQEPWRPPPGSSRVWFLCNAPIKVFYQMVQLFWLLSLILSLPNYILVQNPPAIPTLMVVQLVCWLRSIRLVIDWHNFGYTILALNLGFQHPVTRIAAYYERWFGSTAYAHLCVTEAMAKELRRHWQVRGKVIVLYDKAPEHFRRLSVREAHQFWCDLTALHPGFKALSTQLGTHTLPRETWFTTMRENAEGQQVAEWRKDRPRVVVSSTSWTVDEDFSLLLRAAEKYDQSCEQMAKSPTDQDQGEQAWPSLVLLITGRGPQRAYYEAEIRRLALRHVHILTLWLAAEDYPRLLGVADLGVSLHQSSSGLDLPMKVVDMFGCGLPVCAVRFPCINELVQHGRNGWVFDTSDELARLWMDLFQPLDDLDQLSQARCRLRTFQSVRWSAYWNSQVGDLFVPTTADQSDAFPYQSTH
ncbi:mannosyltransferase [Dispira parvispora]|uniref:Chitobiosyldiphosphodolichol beta-mannosyltransferase n=1 Tax=Dispira parvispora TaxID=1520584 RepID=A0A9W8AR45_9FUNG|nr:mannosyltransferase [Dispira parvispora]